MAISTSVKSLQDEMRKDPGTGSDVNRISQLAWIFFLKVWMIRRPVFHHPMRRFNSAAS